MAVIQPTAVVEEDAAFRIVIVQTEATFQQLATAWQDLFHRAECKNPFIAHWWLMTFLRFFNPDDLLVITIENAQGQLIGVAPFQINRASRGMARRTLRHLQFIGTDPDVYDSMDFLLDPAYDPEPMVHVIAKTIKRYRGSWDVLDLRYMHNAASLEILQSDLEHTFPGLKVTEPMSLHLMTLPDTVEDFPKACLSHGMRRDIKRVYNKIEREYSDQPLRLESLVPGTQSAFKLDQFFDLHTEYWQAKEVRTNLMRFPKLRPFYHTVFQYAGTALDCSLDFTALYLGDTLLSYQLGFKIPDCYMGYLIYYNAEYQKIRPGVITLCELVKRQIAAGDHFYSLGRGDESYKTHWQCESKPVYSLVGFKNAGARLGFSLDETLKQLIGRG